MSPLKGIRLPRSLHLLLVRISPSLARHPDSVGANTVQHPLEQRNKLARCLFEEVWLEDKTVVAVKPKPEPDPFFRLNYQKS